jgi:hypothetical protein
MKIPQLPTSIAGTTSDFKELPTIMLCSGPSPWRMKMRR